MATRLYISFSHDEFAALLALSASELRIPAEQARLIIREELLKRGYPFQIGLPEYDQSGIRPEHQNDDRNG